MTQTENELLMKDISCRIPYGVIVNVNGISNVKLTSVSWYGEVGVDDGSTYLYPISEIKPYLFPMSSMTEEQKKYITNKWSINEEFDFEIDPNWGEYFVELGYTVEFIDWLNKNHFDYRGLIDKSLALDATGLNIY